MKMFGKSAGLPVGLIMVIIMLVIGAAEVNADIGSVPFLPVDGSTAAGSDNGQFNDPWGIAVDSSGNVYVSDTGNHRIQKFDTNGSYITQWGGAGTGDGQLNSPTGVAVDSSGNVYVADTHNHRIQKFDTNGSYITQWGGAGTGDGLLNSPTGITVDSSGNVYVADTDNHRIQKFDTDGNYITQWGGEGTGESQFMFPKGITVDSSDDVYVVDTSNHRIQKFESDGTYIKQWGSQGYNYGEFNYPHGIDEDSRGNIYVTDTFYHNIQIFDSDGNFLSRFGNGGSANSQFMYPIGIAIDGTGNVYVVDSDYNRIKVMAPQLKTFTIKGKRLTSSSHIGQSRLEPGVVSSGTITINADQAEDTTEQDPFATIFDMGDSDAAMKVVKYSAGSSIDNFDTDNAYAGEAITMGDFFIVRLTASDTNRKVYYKINVLVAPVYSSIKAGSGQVNMSWNAVPGATGYYIHYDRDSRIVGMGRARNKVTLDGATCNYDATGLTNGSEYYFAIGSIYSGINTEFIGTVNARPIAAPVLQISAAGSDGANLSWGAVAGASGYKVYQRTASGSYGEEALATLAGTAYNVTELDGGPTYYFTVKAINNSNGESDTSNEVSLTTPPAAPVLQSVITGDEQIHISWSSVVGATGYKIYSSTTSGIYEDELDTVSDSVHSYDATGLINGTTYYFVVKAANDGGDSDNSNEVSATPQVAAPGAPVLQSVSAGDGYVNVSWSEVADSTGYNIYASTTSGSYTTPEVTVAESVYSCDVTGLDNGTTYYFVAQAINQGGESAYSNEVSATPRTVPGMPTDVTAAAGNRQATVSFAPPEDNGGSAITGYTVTSNPGNITASGTGTTITVTGLANGTTYTFTVTSDNAAGTGPESDPSNEVTPYSPSIDDDNDVDEDKDDDNGGSGNDNGRGTSSTPVPSTGDTSAGVDILVNGETATAATAKTTQEGDKTVTTVAVDDKIIEEKLVMQGSNTVVTIPVLSGADVAVGQLNGQTIKNMETKEAVLEIKTEQVTYTLPASQINIDAVSEQIGKQVELKDITVSVKISEPTADTVRIVEDIANKNNYQIVVKPVEFEITCSSSNKTVEVSKFNAYVERLVAIPEGVDLTKITTGIILNEDGSFSHVPTVITVIDGKYYAKINSLTNSVYSIISSPKTFADVENHWAKEAVNDMGSRMVVEGVGYEMFAPDNDITRAEFAAIIVRALGLKPETGKVPFTDVTGMDRYSNYIKTATEYKIIRGYGDGKFGPSDKITREQAMTMIARAMEITGLRVEMAKDEMEKLLVGFGDAEESAEYAKGSIAASIKAEIIYDDLGNMTATKDNITRAEVAVIVRRLLQKSGLI